MKDLLVQKAEKSSESVKVLPKHIAIIMDGNRRWAKSKNLPAVLGHKEGVKALKKIVRYASDIGIKYLTAYAFSTENWNRKKDEVDFLMYLIQEVIQDELEDINKNNVKLSVIGFYENLPHPLPKVLNDAINKTKNNTGLKLQMAINYGGRAEIINAIKKIVKKVLTKEITEDDIAPDIVSRNLLTSGIPDPELLIRTGGEQRISNYLLWQSAYAEFYSTETLWPSFSTGDLDKAIDEFNQRQRRFGV